MSLRIAPQEGPADSSELVQQLKMAFPDHDASSLQEAATTLRCDSGEKQKPAPNRVMVALSKGPHLGYEAGADIWYLRFDV